MPCVRTARPNSPRGSRPARRGRTTTWCSPSRMAGRWTSAPTGGNGAPRWPRPRSAPSACTTPGTPPLPPCSPSVSTSASWPTCSATPKPASPPTPTSTCCRPWPRTLPSGWERPFGVENRQPSALCCDTRAMAGSRRKVTGWLTVLFVGLGLVGLGVYFGHIGLGRADKRARVLGAFSGLAGLFLAWLGIVQARHERAQPAAPGGQRDSATPSGHGGDGGQHVSGSVIGRDNIQIGSAGRDIDIRREP